MPILKIKGNTCISGTVTISGSKNSSLCILPASILFDGRITLFNVPDISDIRKMLEIMSDLNVYYTYNKNTVLVNSCELISRDINHPFVKQIRASYYFMGAMLSRYQRIRISYPGGCQIGKRPIDLHLDGFCKLGASITYYDEEILIEALNLTGCEIEMEKKSVGATLNILMASLYAKGKTTILNASVEPEIMDVIGFLKQGGFNILVLGDTIVVMGQKEILRNDFNYTIMPDRIEAGTFIALGLIKGPIAIKNASYKHLSEVISTLLQANAKIEVRDNDIVVYPSILSPLSIETKPYPGFPTDLEQIFSPILAIYGGKIKETIFENRLNNCYELKKMGANVTISSSEAFFEKSTLKGTYVVGSDLRGACSLLLAGMMADGFTYLEGIDYIERGYEHIFQKLKQLGAVLSFEGDSE